MDPVNQGEEVAEPPEMLPPTSTQRIYHLLLEGVVVVVVVLPQVPKHPQAPSS